MKGNALGVCIALAAAVLAAPASGADGDGARAYWVNYGTSTIAHANLDGTGAGYIDTTGATISLPQGLDLNLATGKIWWGNQFQSRVASANLDLTPGAADLPGSDANSNAVSGVAVDPGSGRIYWVNFSSNTVFSSRPDGSDQLALNTTGATMANPSGIALDPAGGRVWWTNYDQSMVGDSLGGSIAYANLDGSGGGTFNTTGATVSGPYGLAIDRAGGKVWWANLDADKISYANLDGSGAGGDLNTTGADLDGPVGVAIDTVTKRVWWANYDTDSLSSAAMNGSGGGSNLPAAASPFISGPDYPVLVRAPGGTAVPVVSGGTTPASTLTCSGEAWAADATGTFFYHAPTSTSTTWSLNGTPIAGATGSTLVASEPGDYTCTATATNLAGETSQTSVPFSVRAIPPNNFKIQKVTHNRKKGTAAMFLSIPAAGKVTLWGKNLKKKTKAVKQPGKVKFIVGAKNKLRKNLKRAGVVSATVKVKFVPAGGSAKTKHKKIKLRMKVKHHG